MDDVFTYTQARQNFSALMDRVSENHEVLAITRGNRAAVVMMSLEDFKSYEETAHLLSSDANRQALAKSLKEIKKGKIVTKSMKELETLVHDIES